MKRMISLLILGLMLVAPELLSQRIPAEVASRLDTLGKAFVNAVNNDTTSVRAGSVGNIFAASAIKEIGEQRLAGFIDKMRGNYGILKYHHSEGVGKAIHLYAQSSKDGKWHDFQFYYDLQPPHKITQIVFIADVSEPIYLPNGDIGSAYTLDWLNGYIDKLAKEDDLFASLLIAHGDSVFFERAFGFADSARTRPTTRSTRFNLGSGNKMFTALAIMQLKEKGKLRLSDTLSRYFPDFPDKLFIQKATIHHLLSHTSGLGDYWTDAYERSWDHTRQLSDVLPFVYDDSISFEPGSQFQYSNSGFLLAGLIVEKVSGQNYFDYIRENIYKPLGMLSTDSYLLDGKTPDLAEPLASAGEGWRVAPHGLRGTSAGGGLSTPRDMLSFVRGLNSGKVVDTADLRTMLEPKNVGLAPDYSYGYGFILNRNETGVVSYGHGGIAPGINFELRYYPKQDITFVIFCNQDNGAYDDLRRNIDKLITGDR